LLAEGHTVLMIEKRRVSYRPDRVPDADWMLADATEIDTLVKAAIHTADVLVAATADDQTNLVVCMFAKTEFGVKKVVARVTNPNNEWMFTQRWGVDVAVSMGAAMNVSFELAKALNVGAV
jgi:trk system potassium uptake protein TrkA